MHSTIDLAAGQPERPTFPRLAAVSSEPFSIAAKDLQVRIGAAIRRRRRAVEVTLLELAQVCGVSFQQVQKYESGACSISAAQLWNMAQALDVPIAYFYATGDEFARLDAA